MKSALVPLAVCLLAVACSASKTDPNGNVPADNTRKNDRDRGGTATPTDQAENDADRGITQKIRQAVMADGSLSVNAKNAKIITQNGAVTLRGPVKSADEKTKIGQLATANGAKSVDNQLEVAN